MEQRRTTVELVANMETSTAYCEDKRAEGAAADPGYYDRPKRYK